MFKIEIDSIDKFLESLDHVKMIYECQSEAESTIKKVGNMSQTDIDAIYANSFSSFYTLKIITAYHHWLMTQLETAGNTDEDSRQDN